MGVKLKKTESVKLKKKNWKIKSCRTEKLKNCKIENSQTWKREKAWNWGHDSIQTFGSKNILWLGDHKYAATIVVCQLDSAHTDSRDPAEACLCLHFISVCGKWPWLFHSELNDAQLLDAEPSLGWDGSRSLPATPRWQGYAHCTYAAAQSIAGLQALAPRFQGGYACSVIKKIAFKEKTQKT